MAKAPKKQEMALLLHNIRSVHNVGSIFRTADAAGISRIYLTGYTPTPIDRFGRSVKELAKVSLGGEKSVQWEYVKNPVLLLKKLRAQNNNLKIIAIEQDKKSVDYKKVKVKVKNSQPVLFIVGNEVEGMPKNILKLCDVIAEIPMKGKKESLNVGVSAGIAVFRILGI
jgi:23S rRNA (guanosine2251-2'-O)-methyltransferase